MHKPTPAYIRSILSYDQITGLFTWIRKKPYKKLYGKKAGAICRGYRLINIDYWPTKAAHLAFVLMQGRWPNKHVDHINGNSSDDSWINLREVNNQENHKNMKRFITNNSGTTGVSQIKSTKRWRAYIMVNAKQIHLGCYKNLEDAKQARINANFKYNFHVNHGRG